MNLRRKARNDKVPLIGVGTVIALIGVGCLSFAYREIGLAQSLRKSGKDTRGIIERLSAAKQLTVDYRYEVAGTRYHGRATLTGEIHSTIGPGLPISVTYMPSRPDRSLSSLEDPNTPGSSGPMRVLGYLFLVIGLGVAGTGWRGGLLGIWRL